jgi:hypothetical protein
MLAWKYSVVARRLVKRLDIVGDAQGDLDAQGASTALLLYTRLSHIAIGRSSSAALDSRTVNSARTSPSRTVANFPIGQQRYFELTYGTLAICYQPAALAWKMRANR